MKKKITSLVFLVFIFAMSVLLFLNSGKKYSESEKRYLNTFPEFSARALFDGTFLTSFDGFVNDHIMFRDFFMALNSYTNLALGKNTVSDIYFCDDGYLINAPKDVDSTLLKKNLQSFDEFAENQSLNSTVMIIPSTGYIMENVLPKNAESYHDDEFFSLAENQISFSHFLDIRSTLKNAKKDVFYKTDHHLTSYGNFLAYHDFCKLENITPCEDYKIECYDDFYGTTYSQSGYFLTKPDTLELWDNGVSCEVSIYDDKKTYNNVFFKEHLKNKDKYPVFLGGNQSFVKIKTQNKNGKKILIVRDSFAQCFAPFLTANFEEIYMVDLRYFRKSVSNIIEQNEIENILFLYGIDTLLSDTNSFWLK